MGEKTDPFGLGHGLCSFGGDQFGIGKIFVEFAMTKSDMLDKVLQFFVGIIALPAGLRIRKRLNELANLFNEVPDDMIPAIDRLKGEYLKCTKGIFVTQMRIKIFQVIWLQAQ